VSESETPLPADQSSAPQVDAVVDGAEEQTPA
jgi:hypothetical protein